MAVPRRKGVATGYVRSLATGLRNDEARTEVYEPHPVRGDVDFESVVKRVMKKTSKTRAYLAQ